MLTVARRLDSEAAIQETRVHLCGASHTLRKVLLCLEAISHDLDSEALDQAVVLLERVLDESLDAHARIDAELLINSRFPWNHPVQAIVGPRAPYGRVATQCRETLDRARGKEHEHLRAIHERVVKAHRLSETARRRRRERAGWSGEGAEP